MSKPYTRQRKRMRTWRDLDLSPPLRIRIEHWFMRHFPRLRACYVILTRRSQPVPFLPVRPIRRAR